MMSPLLGWYICLYQAYVLRLILVMTLQQHKCVMFLAPTRHVANVRPSRDSPHRAVIPGQTPEYQYLWFQFYRASSFTAWQSPQNHRRHPARRRPQTGWPSALLQHWRGGLTLPPLLPPPLSPLPSLSPMTMIIRIRNGFMPHIMGHKLSHIYAREVR
jgi:hypothetical protein